MTLYIEIAVSLLFIFLILSLIVTSINEIISIALSQRSRMLIKALSSLIDDENLRKKFYNNGIIVNSKKASSGENVSASEKNHPSYIESFNFSKAIMMAVLERDDTSDTKSSDLFSYDGIEGAVLKLPDSKIRDVLVSSLVSANKSIEGLEKSISLWYDSSMDRLTGEYTRHQKWISLILGGFLVVFLNVDCISIARDLHTNNVFRQQVIENAVAFASQDIMNICRDTEEIQRNDCLIKNVSSLYDRISAPSFGWADVNLPTINQMKDNSLLWFWSGILKFVGWILTAFAISLGAPFWFDVLQKFVNIRGAGVKPKKASR